MIRSSCICPLRSRCLCRRGFTLIELLVVIGIIVVLIGILLPVIGKVRIASQVADTRNWINQLGSAIERYQQDFRAYPGPLANNEIGLGRGASIGTPFTTVSAFNGGLMFPTTSPPGYDLTTQTAAVMQQKFSMSENLVLGLLGGLRVGTFTAPSTYNLLYDPTAIGGGPVSLNTVGISKRYPAYLDAKQLSWTMNSVGQTGHYFDGSGEADDTIIPEFVDRFGQPMPILYMRAKVGANASGVTDLNNAIVTDDYAEASTPPRPGQYDLSQIAEYTQSFAGTWPSLTVVTQPTGRCIGEGKSVKSSLYNPVAPSANGEFHGLQMKPWTAQANAPTMSSQFPYDAYPYFTGSAGVARQKDGYILISAGADRVYGTTDDIANFGTVGE